MSIALEGRLRKLEARVDELLRSLTQQAAVDEPAASEPKPEATPARRRNTNGRFAR